MSDFEPLRPYRGWTRCLGELVAFDTLPEFQAARSLDASTDVRWWLRNDPVVFRIDTPVGNFEPDFIYERTAIKSAGSSKSRGTFCGTDRPARSV